MEGNLKITDIPVNKLLPNPWNPNRMTDRMRHKLKEYIRKEGFVEPIVVRLKGDAYEILGGYHRWLIAGELGYQTVPCVVLNLDDRRAKVLTINLNEMKGQSLPSLLSELIHDLSKEITLEDIESQLPYSMEELRDSLELLKIPDGLEAFLDAEAARLELDKPKIVSFVVDDTEPIDKAVAVAMARTESNPTRGKALLDICRDYVSRAGSGE